MTIDGAALAFRIPLEPKPLREIDRQLIGDLAIALLCFAMGAFGYRGVGPWPGRVGAMVAGAIGIFAFRDFRRRPRKDFER